MGNPWPIILLSTLQEILAICIIRQIEDKVDQHTPVTQAAYRKGYSTTGQMLALKLMAGKAIMSAQYETTILLIPMLQVTIARTPSFRV